VPDHLTTDMSPPGPEPAGGRPPKSRRLLFALLGLVVVAGAVWAVRQSSASSAATAQKASEAQAARPVPVTAAAVTRRDIPIYLEGLGNVTAVKTVTVRSQVDGRLDQMLFKEGQAVKAGQALAQIDPRPFQIQLHNAQGALARDAAQLASARLDLDRYRALAKDKLVAQQQADDQAGTVGQLEGAVKVDEAAIEMAKLNLDYARITSPVDGITGIRLVDPGNIVHATDTGGIVIVTQLDPIAVIFTLPQDNLPAITEAMSHGPLTLEAFSRDNTTSLGRGELALVDNQINQATSTVRLKAILPNPKHALWPNQFVNARLTLAKREGALIMPATAIQRGPNGTFVYVIGKDATVAPRPVEVAANQGDVVVIGHGLAEGDRVVVDGQNLLRPGSKVAAREAGAGPAAPAAAGGTTAKAEASAR
jgi:membrane fusion protein, multidrug efflux system